MSRKIKHSKSFKLKAVKRVLKRKEGITRICSELCIDKSQLRKWVSYYSLYGVQGLEPKGYNSTYTADFKFKVIQQIQKKGLSFKQASLQFRIPSDSTVLNWYRTYEREGKSGLYNKPKGRPRKMNAKNPKKTSKVPLTREEALLHENESLKAELALLKKLHALTQAKKKKQ